MKNKETPKENLQDYINKNNNIEITDVIGIEKYSAAMVVLLIIMTIIAVILDIIWLNIGGIIFSISCCIASVSSISISTRLIVNIACTTKKNQEIITKLLVALEKNDKQEISDINNEIKASNTHEEATIMQQIQLNQPQINAFIQDKQQCPICYSWFSKESNICPKCGYDTKHPQSMERYMSNKANKDECPNCFAKISPDDTECPNCGYKLK